MKYELRDGYPLRREDFDRRISKAEQYLFSLGVGDAAEEVGRINATLFIARMHYIQEKLGYEPHAMVIGAPDFTFQTSWYKFRDAIPEGAKIIWGDESYQFIPGEMEFDFCGMLIGSVNEDTNFDRILDRIHELKTKNLKVDGKEIELRNFSTGSHFLNVYKVENSEKLDLPERVAIMHTSSNEMRWRLVDLVKKRKIYIKTPFGNSQIIKNGDMEEYFDICKYASSFAKKKRQLLFEEIFENDDILRNQNHYELISTNQANIGCNIVSERELSVITLSDGLPAYLVRTKPNLSPKVIKKILASRDVENWVKDELANANIIPHGGGHKLLGVETVDKVILYPDSRLIIPVSKDKTHLNAYEDMSTIHRSYRTFEVMERIVDLDLAEPYATLRFLYGIKADI